MWRVVWEQSDSPRETGRTSQGPPGGVRRVVVKKQKEGCS